MCLTNPPWDLHAADVHKLIEVLQRLVDAGNSVLIIEHNLEIIKVADWIIDLGPEGGDRGGELIAEGTPEQIVSAPGIVYRGVPEKPHEKANQNLPPNLYEISACSQNPISSGRIRLMTCAGGPPGANGHWKWTGYPMTISNTIELVPQTTKKTTAPNTRRSGSSFGGNRDYHIDSNHEQGWFYVIPNPDSHTHHHPQPYQYIYTNPNSHDHPYTHNHSYRNRFTNLSVCSERRGDTHHDHPIPGIGRHP